MIRSCVIGVAALAGSAMGQAFTVLPVPAGLFYVAPLRISGDGSTVIGYTSGPLGFRWTAAGGTQVFGALPGGTDVFLSRVSHDGRVLAGWGSSSQGQRAFTWTAAGGFQVVPPPPGASGTPSVGGMVIDGSLIVGDHPGPPSQVWRFAGQNAVTFSGGWSPLGMSANGDVIVGQTPAPSQLARWANNQVQFIPPPPGYVEVRATDVSGDGRTVVGFLILGDVQGTRHAMRWTADGGFNVLSTIPGSIAVAASHDGSVVVGRTDRASAWTFAGGPVDLTAYLVAAGANLQGLTLFQATSVSADGGTITGVAAGGGTAWVARMPGIFACYANCDGSTTSPALNVADFSCFLNRFASGSSAANCDGSTLPPVLNVADFSCFLNAFAAGCS